MRVLVIGTNRERSPQTLIPLGACCVAAAAEAAGHDVFLLDLCFSRRPIVDVTESVRRTRPDVIGLSVRNLDNCDSIRPRSYLSEVRQIVDACKSSCDAEVVVGGPAISESPYDVARYLGCRFAVTGEGEVAFPRLLWAIEHGENPASVQGVVSTSGEPISSYATAAELNVLPDPNPARWLNLQRYAASDASLSIQTKRGCPFSCDYCSCPQLEGSTFRLREPAWVADQAEAAERAGMRGIEFVDSVFGMPQGHAVGCCESIARVLKPGMSISSLELNPLACTPELVDAMNAAGFSTVGVTVESCSDTILEHMGKGFTADDVRRAERDMRRLRARKLWLFMFGSPGENERTARETVRFIESLPEGDLVLMTHGVRVLPRTALRNKLVADGLIDSGDSLLEPKFYYSPDVSPERVNRMIAESTFPGNNIVTLTDCGHPLAPVLQRMAGVLGMRPPYWQGLPAINRMRKVLRL